eukprot:3654412-Amphidinium_carterae.1
MQQKLAAHDFSIRVNGCRHHTVCKQATHNLHGLCTRVSDLVGRRAVAGCIFTPALRLAMVS